MPLPSPRRRCRSLKPLCHSADEIARMAPAKPSRSGQFELGPTGGERTSNEKIESESMEQQMDAQARCRSTAPRSDDEELRGGWSEDGGGAMRPGMLAPRLSVRSFCLRVWDVERRSIGSTFCDPPSLSFAVVLSLALSFRSSRPFASDPTRRRPHPSTTSTGRLNNPRCRRCRSDGYRGLSTDLGYLR